MALRRRLTGEALAEIRVGPDVDRATGTAVELLEDPQPRLRPRARLWVPRGVLVGRAAVAFTIAAALAQTGVLIGRGLATPSPAVGVGTSTSPDGELVERSELFTQDVFVRDIAQWDDLTIAARVGVIPDLIVRALGLSALLFTLGRRMSGPTSRWSRRQHTRVSP